jgi:hypothetical protein
MSRRRGAICSDSTEEYIRVIYEQYILEFIYLKIACHIKWKQC